MGRMKQWLGAMLLAAVMITPHAGMAQTPANPLTPTTVADDTCTTFEQRHALFDGTQQTNPDGSTKKGLLTEIYDYITTIVDGSTEKLYNAFINNNAYRAAVGGAMTLMVVIFGVGFMIGVIQPSFGEALKRLFKFGVVAALIAPSGWAFFSKSENGGAGIVEFFTDGIDELITGVMQIAVGSGTSVPNDASPFYQLDQLAEFIIQPDTIVAIMGSAFGSGPYGLGVAGLLLIALITFGSLLIKALRTYAISYVARALLLGVAPVFFVFLLFERTKNLFMSWLNAMISLSLQPLLLFTFLSFFIVMIESAAKDMLSVDLCWVPVKMVEGSTNPTSFWRFKDRSTGQPITSDMSWNGALECVITGNTQCPEFPMNIIDVMTFLILVYLASRFADVVVRLAQELSAAFIALDPAGRFAQVMAQDQARQAASQIGANRANQPRTTTPNAKPQDAPTVPRK